MMLNDQIGQIQHNTGKDCDKKIKDLLERFQVFVSQIKGWEGDANRFAVLLKALDDEINDLCDEADKIVAQNDDNKTNLDQELRGVEEILGSGNSSPESKVETTAEIETKEGPGLVQRRIEDIERSQSLGGGWRSPNELKSMPYGTPVRTVNIKYNKTKNKKKKKKRGTRKKKKKQSRRRRRKGKKGKKGKRY